MNLKAITKAIIKTITITKSIAKTITKITVFGITINIANLTHVANAVTNSGNILGRDLFVEGIGYLGQVAVATGDEIFHPTDIIIEAFPGPGIRFDSVTDFKLLSVYWGAKYGLVNNIANMYKGLIQARHQSFWCPRYTNTLLYEIGTGYFNAFNTPIPTRCGTWRSDTFASYVYTIAGVPLLNKLSSPLYTFSLFPYFSDPGSKSLLMETRSNYVTINDVDTEFLRLSTQELNALPGEEVFKFINLSKEEISPAHAAKAWEFIKDTKVKAELRKILMDMRSLSHDPLSVANFIEMYEAEPDAEIKIALITALTTHYQNNWDHVTSSSEYETLKSFYEKVLRSNPSKLSSPDIVRGFVDFHNEHEILSKANKRRIDKHLQLVEPKLLLGLQFELIRKAPSLEKLYFSKMITSLNKNNNPETDDMFICLMSNGFIDRASEHSKSLMKDFLSDMKMRYHNSDHYRDHNKRMYKDDSVAQYFMKEAEKDAVKLVKLSKHIS